MGFLHTTETPTRPRELNPQIPEPIEHAILKALSKQPMDRYPSVSAFIAALNNQTSYTHPSQQGYIGNTHLTDLTGNTFNGPMISAIPAVQSPTSHQQQHMAHSLRDEPPSPTTTYSGYSLRLEGCQKLIAIVAATILYTALSWFCSVFLTGTVPIVSTLYFAIGFGIPFAIWFGGWAFVIAYAGNLIGAGLLAGLPLPFALWYGTVDLVQLGLAMLLYRLLSKRFRVDPIGKDVFTLRGFIFFVCAILPGNIIGGAYGSAILTWTGVNPSNMYYLQWLIWSASNIVCTLIIGSVLLKTLGPIMERSGLTIRNALY